METFGAAVDGEDDDFLDQQQPDQADDIMSDDDDFPHQQPGQEEEDYFMSDDDDDYQSVQGDHDDDDDDFMSMSDDDEENPFTVHAPPAAASEAAIAALEASEAPANDCCSVCLQDGGEAPDAWPWRRVAPCGHRFHAVCMDRWLRVKLSCPVCRCSAAPAAACRRDAAPEPLPPCPIPDIVEELLAMGYEESLVFDKSPQWMEYMANPYHQVPLAVAA